MLSSKPQSNNPTEPLINAAQEPPIYNADKTDAKVQSITITNNQPNRIPTREELIKAFSWVSDNDSTWIRREHERWVQEVSWRCTLTYLCCCCKDPNVMDFLPLWCAHLPMCCIASVRHCPEDSKWRISNCMSLYCKVTNELCCQTKNSLTNERVEKIQEYFFGTCNQDKLAEYASKGYQSFMSGSNQSRQQNLSASQEAKKPNITIMSRT